MLPLLLLVLLVVLVELVLFLILLLVFLDDVLLKQGGEDVLEGDEAQGLREQGEAGEKARGGLLGGICGLRREREREEGGRKGAREGRGVSACHLLEDVLEGERAQLREGLAKGKQSHPTSEMRFA